jgi:hypothetical protein
MASAIVVPDFWIDGRDVWGIKGQKLSCSSRIHGATASVMQYKMP